MHTFSTSVAFIRPTSLRGEIGIEAFFKAFFTKFIETAQSCRVSCADFKCAIIFIIGKLVLKITGNKLLWFSETMEQELLKILLEAHS